MPWPLRALPLLLALTLAGAAQAAPYRPPRTPNGAPDLQGVWTNGSFTRLERPKELHALVVPADEAAAFDHGFAAAFAGDSSDGVGSRTSEVWELGSSLARIKGEIRSSWIVDPPDGRLPYSEQGRRLLEAAQKRVDSFDDPEARSTSDRCLLGSRSVSGPPMLNANYNNHYQIVQTRNELVILVEMDHDARIISLARKAHLPAPLHPWMGDSIGHWEKDTLAVETTGFNPGQGMTAQMGFYMSPQAKVSERFTRIAPDQILYQFTVDDPGVYAQTWRGEEVLRASSEPLYEYACHEGNYSLSSMLAGARQKEEQGAAKAAP
jgi:hypothetical protein